MFIFNFNSKIVTIAAIALIAYMAYQQYNEKKSTINDEEMRRDFEKAMGINRVPQNAKFVVTISPDKKYEDYTFLEKVITYLYKVE